MKMTYLAAIVLMLSCGVSASRAQGPKLTAVMTEKLHHAQNIFEAVVTSDWAGLEKESAALEQLTADPRWTVLKYPEYARHSAAFLRAVQALRQAAADRDLDETPRAYVAVTLACIDCHRYLARVRAARLPQE